MSKAARSTKDAWRTSQQPTALQWLQTKATTAGPHRWIGLGVVVAVVAALVAWALWPEPPRQREYLDTPTACLLTGDKGVISEPAKPVWATMQEASATSLVRVQNLHVQGPQTADNAVIYLNSLAAARCGVILAVGPAQVEAVKQTARNHPDIEFITVGGGSAADNVQVIDATAPDVLRAAVRDRLTALAEAAS